MNRFLFLTLFSLALFAGSANAELVFDDSFSGFTDGGLNGQGNWGAQSAWTISSGKASASGTTFGRAQRFGGFRVEDNEKVIITLSDLIITGSGSGSNDLFAFGVAKSNEHTGAVTPQLRSELQFDGSSLSIGGATDSGYDSGDSIDLMLTFSRSGSVWSLNTMITNNTDTTTFSGSDASPTNLDGTITTETVVEWMDANAANQLLFGMRELGNFGNSISIGGVKLETVPEPTSLGLFTVGLFGLAVRRRRR